MNNYVLGIARQAVIMMIAISMILLFVGIGILILIHICIVGRAYRRGIGTTNIVERGSLASNSMSHEDIEKLPSYAFQSKDKGTSPIECAVCLDNLKVGEKCRLLPLCNHSFHAECIDLWLLKTSICPICRATADVLKGGESSRYSESGRQELNTETAELAMILVPESDNPVNSLSSETRENHTGTAAQDNEQLIGIVSIDGQITSEVNYVNNRETSNDLRVSQEEVVHVSENSTELRTITQPIESINLVHEELLQSRNTQTAQSS